MEKKEVYVKQIFYFSSKVELIEILSNLRAFREKIKFSKSSFLIQMSTNSLNLSHIFLKKKYILIEKFIEYIKKISIQHLVSLYYHYSANQRINHFSR